MGPLKSLGLDGFGPCFYQKFWSKMEEDVCVAMLNILNYNGMISFLNSTLIALIRKKCRPAFVNEFQPISLCNIVYKLISKVLINTMKPYMHSIILNNQSTFILGRFIIDNIMIAHELLHTMKQNKKGRSETMEIKIDMLKAYDRVEWTYLKAP